jgi:hypothetical protein
MFRRSTGHLRDISRMPLYTIVVEYNIGIGQPICYMFLREETTASIVSGLDIFAKVQI